MANILIADSSLFMIGSLKFLLERMGHSVVNTAPDAKEALVKTRQKMPQLLIMDIAFGEEAGCFSMMKTVRAEIQKIKIIMTVSSTNEAAMAEAGRLGAAGFINKPFNYEDIEAEIKVNSEQYLVSAYKLGFVIPGLDPGIQNLVKTLDFHLRENDIQKQKRQFIHRHYLVNSKRPFCHSRADGNPENMLSQSNNFKAGCLKVAVIGSNFHVDLLAPEKTDGCAVSKTPELIMIINKHLISLIEYLRSYRDDSYRRRFIHFLCYVNSKGFTALLHKGCYRFIKNIISNYKSNRHLINYVILNKGSCLFVSVVSFIVKGYKKGCVSKDYFGHLVPYRILSINSLLVCPILTGAEEKKGSLSLMVEGLICCGSLLPVLIFVSIVNAFIIQILMDYQMSCQGNA